VECLDKFGQLGADSPSTAQLRVRSHFSKLGPWERVFDLLGVENEFIHPFVADETRRVSSNFWEIITDGPPARRVAPGVDIFRFSSGEGSEGLSIDRASINRSLLFSHGARPGSLMSSLKPAEAIEIADVLYAEIVAKAFSDPKQINFGLLEASLRPELEAVSFFSGGLRAVRDRASGEVRFLLQYYPEESAYQLVIPTGFYMTVMASDRSFEQSDAMVLTIKNPAAGNVRLWSARPLTRGAMNDNHLELRAENRFWQDNFANIFDLDQYTEASEKIHRLERETAEYPFRYANPRERLTNIGEGLAIGFSAGGLPAAVYMALGANSLIMAPCAIFGAWVGTWRWRFRNTSTEERRRGFEAANKLNREALQQTLEQRQTIARKVNGGPTEIRIKFEQSAESKKPLQTSNDSLARYWEAEEPAMTAAERAQMAALFKQAGEAPLSADMWQALLEASQPIAIDRSFRDTHARAKAVLKRWVVKSFGGMSWRELADLRAR